MGPTSAAQEPGQAGSPNAEPAPPSWSDRATGGWLGARAELLRRGIELDIDLEADHSTNLAGGLRRGSVLRRPARLALSIATQPLLGWKGGRFNGATHEGCHGRTGNRGPATLWGDPRALFVIGEAGLQWKARGQLAGRIGAGAWRHTGSFERYDGGREPGAPGSYVVLDQAVWRETASASDEQGVAAFAQLGWANASVGGAEVRSPVPSSPASRCRSSAAYEAMIRDPSRVAWA